MNRKTTNKTQPLRFGKGKRAIKKGKIRISYHATSRALITNENVSVKQMNTRLNNAMRAMLPSIG